MSFSTLEIRVEGERHSDMSVCCCSWMKPNEKKNSLECTEMKILAQHNIQQTTECANILIDLTILINPEKIRKKNAYTSVCHVYALYKW